MQNSLKSESNSSASVEGARGKLCGADRSVPSAEKGPIELDLSALKHVSGGGPNGTWASAAAVSKSAI